LLSTFLIQEIAVRDALDRMDPRQSNQNTSPQEDRSDARFQVALVITGQRMFAKNDGSQVFSPPVFERPPLYTG
jgi:hypothetical protein